VIDYQQYLDRMIVEIADRQSGVKIESIKLVPIHDELFPEAPLSWRESLASELHRQGLGVDWQATDNLSFLPNGALFARAAEIRRTSNATTQAVSPIDWAKWGSIAGIAAVPLAILLWWFA
jgi:hypothetical protein